MAAKQLPTADLWAVLDMIRVRPAMWFGKKDIWALSGFLTGLQHFSHASHGAGPHCVNLVSDPPYEEFHGWASRGARGPIMWALKLAYDEAPEGTQEQRNAIAFDIWFRLLDEFRAANGLKQAADQS